MGVQKKLKKTVENKSNLILLATHLENEIKSNIYSGKTIINEITLLNSLYLYMEHIGVKLNIENINGVFFYGDKNTNSSKTLIVSGNARSGTTALGDLFSVSDEIMMLTERFVPHLGYHPNMFTEKYIYYNGYAKRQHFEQSEKVRSKIYNAKYIGDKRPGFFSSWDITAFNYSADDIIIVHIVRDIYGIAYSYDKRAKDAEKGIDKSWSSNRGIKHACVETNLQNRLLLKALDNREFNRSIYLVNYHEIFTSLDILKKLYNVLDVELTDLCIKALNSTVNKGKKLKNKSRNLSDEQLEIIDKYFDFDLLKKINAYKKNFIV